MKPSELSHLPSPTRTTAPIQLGDNFAFNQKTVAGCLEVFGYINIVGSGLGALVSLVEARSGQQVFHLIVASFGCLATGFLFLAGAEILTRLREISRAVQQTVYAPK